MQDQLTKCLVRGDGQPQLENAISMTNKIQKMLIALAIFAGINHVAAQNTVFTYQGRVTDNSTNFNGTGEFKFALVTSSNANHTATATAAVTSGFVTSIAVVSGGNGYTATPAIAISGGGGSGATASTSMSGGVVTGVNVLSPGSGYTSTPTVTIAPPPANIAYSTFWSNDGTGIGSGSTQPTSAVSAGVTNGLFTVALGDMTLANMTAISASLFTQPNLQLRIWFSDGVNGFAALSPLQNLTPVPYAIQAINANSASNLLGTIQPTQLDGPLTLAQLPVAIVTNSASGVTLSGIFSGDGSGLHNTVTTASYVYAYDTGNHLNSIANTFQGISFGGVNQSGWTYIGDGAATFTCPESGTYLVQYAAEAATTINSATTISLRVFNLATAFETAGSESSVVVSVANQPIPVAKSFLAYYAVGNAIQFQFTGNNTSAQLIGGVGASTYQPSVSFTVIRIQ